MSDKLFDLTGRVALVTGASRGIGAAIAKLLAKHGAEVIVSSRKIDDCKIVAAEIVDVDTTGIMECNEHWITATAAEALASHTENGFYPECADQYGPIFKDLLEQGSKMSAADYAQIQFARTRVTGAINGALANVDVMLCPPMPMPAPPAEAFPPQQIVPNENMGPVGCFTVPFNFSGHPTITQPCGFLTETTPLALQLVAKHGEESTLIHAAYAYEQATEWHLKKPAV